jgi:hypothetical protein
VGRVPSREAGAGRGLACHAVRASRGARRQGGGAARGVALLAALAFAAPACVDHERPSPDEWRELWTETRAAVPGPQAFVVSETRRETCDRVLAELRSAYGRLLPAPDEELDSAVREWLHFAEGFMLECPLRGGEQAGFEAGFRHLDELAAVVDTASHFGETLPPSAVPRSGPG